MWLCGARTVISPPCFAVLAAQHPLLICPIVPCASEGEAYDKVARLLGLDLMPSGGAALEAFAARGDPKGVPLTVPMRGRPSCDFRCAPSWPGAARCGGLRAWQRRPGLLAALLSLRAATEPNRPLSVRCPPFLWCSQLCWAEDGGAAADRGALP